MPVEEQQAGLHTKEAIKPRRAKLRGLYLGVLRVSQRASHPISTLGLRSRVNRTVTGLSSSYVVPVIGDFRKFLQSSTKRLTSTRYLVHILVVVTALTLTLSGFARHGFIKQAEAARPYVVAFGSQRSTLGYAPLEHGGYLIKGSISQTDITVTSTKIAREYYVQGGDTMGAIAERFGVSQKTILWANQLLDGSKLKPGQKLVIPATTGIVHKVEANQTIEDIANKYHADANEVIAYNELITPIRLKADQELAIPLSDDKVPEVPKPEPVQIASSSSSNGGSFNQYQPTGPINASGQFVWPASGVIYKNFFQHSRGDGAIDISNRSAPPVVASDSGVVTVAGWGQRGYSCYGNVIDIDHGNGFKTRYAHLSEIWVSAGQSVSQGQAIGKMGTTGCSTGIHLHFMIIYNGVPQNPIDYLP
jgi:murein DD-endopeptidase MepM/ murein hydrolase activator NlpD